MVYIGVEGVAGLGFPVDLELDRGVLISKNHVLEKEGEMAERGGLLVVELFEEEDDVLEEVVVGLFFVDGEEDPGVHFAVALEEFVVGQEEVGDVVDELVVQLVAVGLETSEDLRNQLGERLDDLVVVLLPHLGEGLDGAYKITANID